MRGNPLDFNGLMVRIAAVDHRASVTYTDKDGNTHTYSRRSMDKGWLDIYRREWRYLWQELNVYCDRLEDSSSFTFNVLDNPNFNHAKNILRKICGGIRLKDGHTYVQYRNKLYITKAEMPWLIEWLKQQCQNGIDPKYFE